MDLQRQGLFSNLSGISDGLLWHRPAPNVWSVGENLDHSRVFNKSMLRLLRVAWALLLPVAKLRRSKPYEVDYDNVYERPNFPMNTGWMWPARHTPERPLSHAELEQGLTDVHCQAHFFYSSKDPDLLGHVPVYDPVIGRMNLIQALRVALYHDELHFDHVRELLAELE